MSNAEDFDILVAGAGPAGLMTACLLATLGLRAVCVGPRPSPGAQRDNRTTALFQGAIRLLEKVGAWEALKPDAAALSVMRIVDCCGRETYPSIIDFPASEIGDAPFGYNIVNRNLTDVLARRAEALGMPLVDDHVAAYEISDDAVRVHLAAGNSLKARLIIAADGRASPARASAGIQARQWEYGQTATVFTVEQQHPP
ncbi:MAG: FAD-dependent monooxygenase, partial [Hyphomicrobiales bacterium]